MGVPPTAINGKRPLVNSEGMQKAKGKAKTASGMFGWDGADYRAAIRESQEERDRWEDVGERNQTQDRRQGAR